MVQVYARPYCQRHYAALLSEASIFLAFGHIATITMTLVVVISCGGMWKQLELKTEQPLATAAPEALMLLEGHNVEETIIWSTDPALNAAFRKQLAGVHFQVGHIDENDDGKPDAIKVKAVVKTFVPILNIKVFLQLRYTLSETTKVDMYSLAYLQHSSAVPANGLITNGQLKLEQRNPLTRFGQTWYGPVFNFTMANATVAPWLEEVVLHLPKTYQEYLSRNVTTSYTCTDAWWQSGAAGRFDLDMTIQVPTHQVVMRRPQLLEELKSGWVQFVAVYCIFRAVFRGFQWFAFHSRVVDTHVVSDFQQKPQHF